MNHREAWELIPWLVNGSLEAAERASIDAHVAACTECRAEVQAQRTLFEAMNAQPQVEAMPRASMQALWTRLDAEAAPWIRRQPLQKKARRISIWLNAAAAAVLVLLLGALLFALREPQRDSPVDEFRTVSDAAVMPTGAGIRAVFAGDMSIAELQALLESAALHIVAGPTASGVYTLATGGDLQAALDTLRAHPAVRFAEPTGPATDARR